MQLMASRPLIMAMCTLLLGSAAPWLRAQGSAAASSAGIYSCTDDQGRRITADRPIPSCTAKEQRVLNKDGSLKTVFPPILTAEERAEKEAHERKLAEARATQADAVRRDRNLLARYPNEAPHRKAREAALDTVRAAIKTTEMRLQDLAAERKPLLAEAEFYVGKALAGEAARPARRQRRVDLRAARSRRQPGSRAGACDASVRRRTRAPEAAVGRRRAGLVRAAVGTARRHAHAGGVERVEPQDLEPALRRAGHRACA